jgi:hypothetical protein
VQGARWGFERLAQLFHVLEVRFRCEDAQAAHALVRLDDTPDRVVLQVWGQVRQVVPVNDVFERALEHGGQVLVDVGQRRAAQARVVDGGEDL